LRSKDIWREKDWSPNKMKSTREMQVRKEVRGLTARVLEMAVEYNSVAKHGVFSPVTTRELREKYGLALLLFAQEKDYKIPQWRISKYTGEVCRNPNGNVVTPELAGTYAERAEINTTSLLADEFPVERKGIYVFGR
jgi:hypothetical protein